MAVEKLIALDNLAPVVENEAIPANTELDPTMANAVIEDAAATDKVEEVLDELAEKAEAIVLEAPEAPEVTSDNIYTKKYTLDESIEDFQLITESVNDDEDAGDEDEYLDYDMYYFIYGIVTDSWPKPKNPLSHPIRKFRYTGEDDYVNTQENKGLSQVSSDYDGNIVVSSNSAEDFDDVRAVCEHYHIKCSDVKPRRSSDSHWAYSMTIEVPVTSEGYPVMVADFFEPYGLTVADVIEDHKVGGGKTSNWGSTYAKKVNKDREEAEAVVNNDAVEDIYTKHRNRAGRSNEPLDSFIQDMFSELKEKNLKYNKSALKKRFLAEFEDDFEDDVEEGLIGDIVSGVKDKLSSLL